MRTYSDVEADVIAAQPLTGHRRRARAHRRVQHEVAGVRAGPHKPFNEGQGFSERIFACPAGVGLARITLDFDGSVRSTGRFTEGTAVGYNKKKKGARSYYPLFCTIAQTGQVLDFLHRGGNVHDSHGARTFIVAGIQAVREASYFETAWKPQCWDRRFRFGFIRTRTKQQHKGPVQLDLFIPYA